jgi:hypothetical protein
MINNVSSYSRHIQATGGSSIPYVSANMSNPIQGMVRVNGTDMEIFDGHSWMKMHQGSATIGLNRDAEDAITWAIERMKEEQAWAELAEKNAAVKIALDNLEQARQRLSVTAQLAREYDTETTS